MIFNKTEQPIFTTISSTATLDDGSTQVKYVVGFADETENGLDNFRPIADKYLYLSKEETDQLNEQLLTEKDIGKKPMDIQLDRIYEFLKQKGEILV